MVRKATPLTFGSVDAPGAVLRRGSRAPTSEPSGSVVAAVRFLLDGGPESRRIDGASLTRPAREMKLRRVAPLAFPARIFKMGP
jgi:hypothetical protein